MIRKNEPKVDESHFSLQTAYKCAWKPTKLFPGLKTHRTGFLYFFPSEYDRPNSVPWRHGGDVRDSNHPKFAGKIIRGKKKALMTFVDSCHRQNFRLPWHLFSIYQQLPCTVTTDATSREKVAKTCYMFKHLITVFFSREQTCWISSTFGVKHNYRQTVLTEKTRFPQNSKQCTYAHPHSLLVRGIGFSKQDSHAHCLKDVGRHMLLPSWML